MEETKEDNLQSETEDSGAETTDEQTDETKEELTEDDSENKFLDQKRRAEKAEAKLAKLQEALVDKGEDAKTDDDKPPSTVDLSVRDVLDLQAEGYSNSEIQLMDRYAQRLKMPVSELVKDELVKSAIEAYRNKSTVERTTPAPSVRTKLIGKDVDVSKMTETEKDEKFSFDNWKRTRRNR